ncbi:MAG: hypothetical protein AAGC76_09665 [Luteibacter sp.]|uniref:hypothetical protein n=1 Tax=Luteibacter sp. TaxID=1886636 RepID=UPI00280A15A7|nr:hypothetical protein [Luteibacter sp.]MDQ7996108.1 hypothetical protein [Luteibacter sp.]
MTSTTHKRGIAHIAADGTIKVFCGGYFTALTLDEAVGLRDQIDAAIARAEGKG